MRQNKWFAPTILALIGFALYLPSFFGQFLWDDEQLIYQNQYVLNFRLDKFFTDSATAGRGVVSNYYRPVQSTIYAVINLMLGLRPFYFHLVAVLLHLAAAVATYRFFLLLSRKRLVSFLIAVFFLVHPIQTEAVSYISGLSDPLFVLFGFLCLTSFLGHRHLFSLFYFLLCLLSKETGLVFAPLIFLTWFFCDKTHALRRLFPYILITGVYLLFHFTYINNYDSVAGWGDGPYAHSLLLRLATFVQNLYLYLSLTIFPKTLFMERDLTISLPTTIFTPTIVSFVLINLAILGGLLRHYHKQKKYLPLLCFLGFYISFLPVSGLILINGIFYEHFLYLPLVFFAAFFLFLLEKKLLSRPGLVILTLYFVMLAGRTAVREYDWIDPVRFYQQTLNHAPNSIRIRNNLGMAYSDRGETDQAITLYQESIKIDPRVPNLYHNLAQAYQSKGDNVSAEKYYQEAIAIDPNFFYSHASLYQLYQSTGQKAKADDLLGRYPQFLHQ